MSLIKDISRVGGMLGGAASQIVNSITGRITLPLPMLPAAPIGDVLEPIGDDARRGADLIERAAEAIFGGPGRVDANAVRAARPLLAMGAVQSPGGGALSQLTFTAAAVGLDWGVAGRESSRIAVYVDGRYQSTVIVLAERSGSYTVNLGALPEGGRRVELRLANDLASAGAPPVQVSNFTSGVLTGDAALVARHAPILELRDVDRTGAHSTAHSDAPMLLVPAITSHADGTRTIEYRYAFSNEEGGTPAPKLLGTYGRTADLEPAYRVHVRADGSIIDSTYQGAVHTWRPFDGEREGDRPVLRVSTANNMYSTRVRAAGAGSERWSEVPVGAVGPTTSDFEVMRAHAWTWTVMAKELVREGKTAGLGEVRGRHQVGDPRRYVFIGPLADATRGAILLRGGLELVLADGRRVLAKVAEGFAEKGYHQGALELPTDVVADAVRGVALLGVTALMLDASLRMRDLASAA